MNLTEFHRHIDCSIRPATMAALAKQIGARIFKDAGIPCSISTDDPGIFGTTLQDEFGRCQRYLGMRHTDIAKTNEFATAHTFLK